MFKKCFFAHVRRVTSAAVGRELRCYGVCGFILGRSGSSGFMKRLSPLAILSLASAYVILFRICEIVRVKIYTRCGHVTKELG